MEKLEVVLKAWQQVPPRETPVNALLTLAELQPRDVSLVPHKDRYRVNKASDEHVMRMHLALEAGKEVQLEPILVAEIDGGLYVLDGHHRLKAYKRTGRSTIPARVFKSSMERAVMASKLVNVGGAKLAMTHEQSRDACWQFVAHVTARGRVPCPLSARELAGMFGVGKDTAMSMVHRVKCIKATDFAEAARDPGTGWPRWRYVKEAVARRQLELDDPEAHRLWRAKKDAGKLAAFFAQIGSERFKAAVALLISEDEELGGAESLKALGEWSALQEPVTY